jgi:Transposase DDE domain group 1
MGAGSKLWFAVGSLLASLAGEADAQSCRHKMKSFCKFSSVSMKAGGRWFSIAIGSRNANRISKGARPSVVAFYNKRGTCEQWIKEGKGAIKWTRLSCRTFAANAVRLQLHALAYNLGNFLRTLATPEPIKDWSLTTLKDKLIKIGAKVVSHGRYVIFQMAQVAIARQMFQEILRLIAELRPQPPPALA